MTSPDIISETLPQASQETPEQRWRFFIRALRILAPAFSFAILTACSSDQTFVPPAYAVPVPGVENYSTPTPDFAGTPEFIVTPDPVTVIPGPMPTPPTFSAEVSGTPPSSYTPSATEQPQATVTATPAPQETVEASPDGKPLGYRRGFDARQVFRPVRELKPKPQYRRTA